MQEFLVSLRRIINPAPETGTEEDQHTATAKAAAVLLLEMAMADDHAVEEEHQVIEQAIQQAFGLDDAQRKALMGQARSIQQQSTSLHDFTQQLRRSMNAHERGDLIEWLWHVAYADGALDQYEEQLIRRMCDLVGVPHMEMMRRKHRAIKHAGLNA